MGDAARDVWARTRLVVWPERYVLASLPLPLLAEAAALVGGAGGRFAALVVERDEVSLTIEGGTWQREQMLRVRARAEAGPYCAITLDVDVDLSVCGYLAPAAVLLAEAGISLVPQCAYSKDHLLVREADLGRALKVLERLIAKGDGS
jgi:hypothetical protein